MLRSRHNIIETPNVAQSSTRNLVESTQHSCRVIQFCSGAPLWAVEDIEMSLNASTMELFVLGVHEELPLGHDLSQRFGRSSSVILSSSRVPFSTSTPYVPPFLNRFVRRLRTLVFADGCQC